MEHAIKTSQADWPSLMTFANGKPVQTAADWDARREEILELYREKVYGRLPDPEGESVQWALEPHASLPAQKLTVTVKAGEREASFTVLVSRPEGEQNGPLPCYLEYGFAWGQTEFVSPNCVAAAARGYAGITYFPTQVAADNDSHTGAFYTLYPFDKTDGSFPGVLAAWAWGVSKIIDALENGAGKSLGIDPQACIVAGVSRYGKSAAVAGAYDPRIRVTVPSCSGAGGVAVFRTDNHGKEYDLTSLGGPDVWINESVNEPLSNLQGGEGYWFCENFRVLPDAFAIPVEQYMLCALAAGKDRHLIVVTGIVSEGWNNTEGQCLAWHVSRRVWKLLGQESHTRMIVHLDGHAILPEDLRMILDYCDAALHGEPLPDGMQGEFFLQANRDRLDPAFDLL